jgi:hypothetical protein
MTAPVADIAFIGVPKPDLWAEAGVVLSKLNVKKRLSGRGRRVARWRPITRRSPAIDATMTREADRLLRGCTGSRLPAILGRPSRGRSSAPIGAIQLSSYLNRAALLRARRSGRNL